MVHFRQSAVIAVDLVAALLGGPERLKHSVNVVEQLFAKGLHHLAGVRWCDPREVLQFRLKGCHDAFDAPHNLLRIGGSTDTGGIRQHVLG
ncbi:MAG: hypothetical protein BWY57_03134 [Betaproteobacteria bacterium ADurb.Bin341]|nr:MAG: hypothetical protein BWY57_03134 [Betaproteobacteria bacterium ADurb.Bin341]